MLNYLRIVCMCIGLASFLAVCLGGDILVTCPHAKTSVLSCEHALVERVNAQLAAFGKSFSSVDLDNVTESELLDEKTRDVVCSESNIEYVSCIIDNISSCPELEVDPEITSTWIASLIAPHLDIVSSPQLVCEFFQDSVCSYREIKLNTCYNDIIGEVETENAKVDMCSSDKLGYLTCMLEAYRECKPYLNLTDNNNIAINIKVRMVQDSWESFNTGPEMCDCYEGKECYNELNRDIRDATISAVSVNDEYQNTIALVEVLCSNITRVKCALKGRPPACKNVLPTYNTSSTEISVYNTAVDAVCSVVNSKNFENEKKCIIDRLVDSFHSCIKKATLPTPINECSDLRKIYSCVRDALNGKCNGEYVDTAYGIIMTSCSTTLSCDVTSASASFSHIPVTWLLLMSLLYFYAYLK